MADPDDHLYGLPLEEFTPARDAAARELKRAGDREAAARVAKLPKPTPAAWTANQVAREQPELIEALLEAGAALREAQEAAVSGHGARGLRDATLAERGAVDAVMAAATAHRPAGRALSRPLAERLRTTLHAAAGDEALRAALANGRLVSEAQAGGAWPFALDPGGDEAAGAKSDAATAGGEKAAAKSSGKQGAATAGGEKAAAKPGAKRGAAAKGETAAERAERKAAERAEREAEAQAERERIARARAERKALESQLRDARMSLRVRERVATGAAEDAETAADAVAEADERLEEAKQAAEDARADAESAQRVLAEAQAELERARDDVARLEERLD